MTHIVGSLPKLLQFHSEYYRELRWCLEMNKAKKFDLPREVFDDLLFLMNRCSNVDYDPSCLKLFEMLGSQWLGINRRLHLFQEIASHKVYGGPEHIDWGKIRVLPTR